MGIMDGKTEKQMKKEAKAFNAKVTRYTEQLGEIVGEASHYDDLHALLTALQFSYGYPKDLFLSATHRAIYDAEVFEKAQREDAIKGALDGIMEMVKRDTNEESVN